MSKTLELYQSKHGYRYNSDTIFLYDFISKFSLKGDVLDIGCGCGILGLLLKRDFEDCNLDLVDILEHNCEVSKKNAELNDMKARVLCSDFLQVDGDKKYDILVSNPPFYHKNSQKSPNEHIDTSRYSLHLPLDSFIKKSYTLLKDKGYFMFCYDAKQIVQILYALKSHNFNTQQLCFVHSKDDKPSSLVLIRARKNAKAMCEIIPPIISSTGSSHTKMAEDIFKKANTLSKDLL